jgi:hypothetical protein
LAGVKLDVTVFDPTVGVYVIEADPPLTATVPRVVWVDPTVSTKVTVPAGDVPGFVVSATVAVTVTDSPSTGDPAITGAPNAAVVVVEVASGGGFTTRMTVAVPVPG